MLTTLGERAALELRLQDARRDLQRLVDERSELFRKADVASALACDDDQNAIRRNTEATGYRLAVFKMAPDIHAAQLRVRNLESQLKSAPAQVAPVVLTRDEVEGQDDMAGLLA